MLKPRLLRLELDPDVNTTCAWLVDEIWYSRASILRPQKIPNDDAFPLSPSNISTLSWHEGDIWENPYTDESNAKWITASGSGTVTVHWQVVLEG